MAAPKLHLSGDRQADALLSKDPLALLIGMVLDQQIPLERAFAAPAELASRLGGPYDAARLAGMDPDTLAAVFSTPPALHRFPGSMAARVQALCAVVVDRYGGDASRVWRDAPDASQLLSNVKELPGFGEQKARIFVALLGKQLGVRPEGWEAASSPFGDPGTFRSIADIVGPESLAEVRAFKQQMKAAAKGGAGKGDAVTGRAGKGGAVTGRVTTGPAKRPAAARPR
jgi:uncharacterized HhH-GPD family protein